MASLQHVGGSLGLLMLLFRPIHMPQLVSLAAYSVKVWNGSDRDYETLSDFDADGTDLLDVLQAVLVAIKNSALDQKELQQALAVPRVEKNGRTLKGIIETGEYGRESNIMNVATKQVSYRRKKEDAELWPFYFFLEIPEGTEDGLLILQRTAHYGVRKVLHWVLGTAFTDEYPDLQLRLQSLVDQSEVDKFVNGTIQKISFIRKSIPVDIVDAWDKGHQEIKGYVELVMHARRGSGLPMNNWLTKLLKSGKPTGIFALDEDEGFAYENVKAMIKIGRSSRTINAGNPTRLRSYYDVTDAVTIDSGGHPEYDSIHAQAQKLATRLRAVLYGTRTP